MELGNIIPLKHTACRVLGCSIKRSFNWNHGAGGSGSEKKRTDLTAMGCGAWYKRAC